MYVYILSQTEPVALYTVGFYTPDGDWKPESDHANSNAAAERVHWLNGGNGAGDGPDMDMTP